MKDFFVKEFINTEIKYLNFIQDVQIHDIVLLHTLYLNMVVNELHFNI